MFLYLDRFGKWAKRKWRRVLSRKAKRPSEAHRAELALFLRRHRAVRLFRSRSRLCAPRDADRIRPYKELKGWKGQPARRGREGRVVAGFSRSRTQSPRAAGRRRQPDAQGRRGELPRGAGADCGSRAPACFRLSAWTARSRAHRRQRMSSSPRLSAAWTLDIWGKVRRTIEQEAPAAQVERRRCSPMRRSPSQSSLAIAYLTVARSRFAARAAYDDTVKQYQRSLDITQNQYKAATPPESDVITAQAQVLAAQAQAIDTEVSRARRANMRSRC